MRLVRRGCRTTGSVVQAFLAFDAPPFVPLAEGLASHAGLSGDVADRPPRIDAPAEPPPAFRRERGVRVGHESLLLVRVRSQRPTSSDAGRLSYVSSRPFLSTTSRSRTTSPRDSAAPEPHGDQDD